jgi:SAM-dependent methyltransferase
MASSGVVEREQRFYNQSGGSYRRWRLLIWRAIGAFNRNHELDELYDPTGKDVLLYGCGPGHEAERFVAGGARSIVGIDISDVEIERARQAAAQRGYADRVEFFTGDAHATPFTDDAFDLIVGTAILHHLDLDRALHEIRRILRPGGRAVFLEPLAHNPLLRIGRLLTPAARTADEHPFTVEDWRRCGEVFPGFKHREVELTSTILMPLNLVLPQALQEQLAPRVSAFDDRLLARRPRLRPYARSTLLALE